MNKKLYISVLGDGGCGKSTLINKYCYDEFISKTTSTIGVDYMNKIIAIDGENITLDIYDTAGQEHYRNIVKSYYRKAHGVLLIFDLTSHESFESLTYWLEEIKNNIVNPYAEIILVGTKSDLSKYRKVYDDEIVDFANQHNLKYIETSSKKGFNIDSVFSAVAYNIINKMNNPMYEKFFAIEKKPQKINKSYFSCW